MKKFFLLMALVLTAGVVHAQGNTPNFGNRARLAKAEKLYANFPASDNQECGSGTVNGVSVTYLRGWDKNQKKLYWSNGETQETDIFTSTDFSNKLNGSNLLDVFENFVIRTKDTNEWQHYYGRSSSGDITSSSQQNGVLVG